MWPEYRRSRDTSVASGECDRVGERTDRVFRHQLRNHRQVHSNAAIKWNLSGVSESVK